MSSSYQKSILNLNYKVYHKVYCKECLISFKSRKNVTSLDLVSDSPVSNMDRNADSPGSTVDQKADSPRDKRADLKEIKHSL